MSVIIYIQNTSIYNRSSHTTNFWIGQIVNNTNKIVLPTHGTLNTKFYLENFIPMRVDSVVNDFGLELFWTNYQNKIYLHNTIKIMFTIHLL